MKLTIKEILIIAILTVATFPLVYVGMLFFTGNAKVTLTNQDPISIALPQRELKSLKQSHKRDSLELVQSEVYIATMKEREEIQRERELLTKQKERINELSSRLDVQYQQIAAERKKFENAVAQIDSLEEKKLKQLAKIYASMRPNEAARILETMDDKTITKVLSVINDDRQRAKILANFSQDKATKISTAMSKVNITKDKAH